MQRSGNLTRTKVAPSRQGNSCNRCADKASSLAMKCTASLSTSTTPTTLGRSRWQTSAPGFTRCCVLRLRVRCARGTWVCPPLCSQECGTPAREAPTVAAKAVTRTVTAVEAHRHLADRLANKFSKVQHAFRLFDENKDGTVSKDEFRRALASFGLKLSDRQFREFCVAYDPHGTGAISYTQFNNRVLCEEVAWKCVRVRGNGPCLYCVGWWHDSPQSTRPYREKGKAHPAQHGGDKLWPYVGVIRAHIQSCCADTVAPAVTVATWVEKNFAEQAVKRLKSVEHTFKMLDTDGSGALSLAEFTQVPTLLACVYE